MTLVVRRARDEADLDAMIELRAEAEHWLRAQGIRQWTDDYADYARGVLRDSVDRGAAWVVEDDGLVVATVTINGPDPDFWGWVDDPDDALYLGKMIVARSRAGQYVGDAIMNWASQRAARSGKRWVRIDCRRDNERLHAYYLARGFTYVRTYHAPSRRTESGWLAQRPAELRTHTPIGVIEATGHDGAVMCAPYSLWSCQHTSTGRPPSWLVARSGTDDDPENNPAFARQMERGRVAPAAGEPSPARACAALDQGAHAAGRLSRCGSPVSFGSTRASRYTSRTVELLAAAAGPGRRSQGLMRGPTLDHVCAAHTTRNASANGFGRRYQDARGSPQSRGRAVDYPTI